MELDKVKNINSILGTRFKTFREMKSGIGLGNFLFTVFFNFLKFSCHKDVLCCAKSFYKSDINIKKIESIGFDIDIELTSFLTKNRRGKKIKQVFLKYTRRSIVEGKKLKVSDGWVILKRILLTL